MASILSDTELDLVGGGKSAYYDLFFWLGEMYGELERGHSDLIDRNGGVEYLF